MPLAPIQFTPLKDFHSEEFHSDYCVGLSYTARPEDTKLRALLPDWIKDGKVRLGVPDAPEAAGESRLSGVGEVQTIGPVDVGTLKP